MPSLPPELIVVLAPFAQLFSDRVWVPAQGYVLGVLLAPGKRMVSSCLRVRGWAWEEHFTNYHRVLNRATWSALQARRSLLGLLVQAMVPPGATSVLGADDTIERRSGRQIKAKGCDCDVVRSSRKHVVKCFGLKGVSMMLLVPVPWATRVWALPFLTGRCWPPKSRHRRRHKTRVDWVRQRVKQTRRWLPGRLLVLVGDGGHAISDGQLGIVLLFMAVGSLLALPVAGGFINRFGSRTLTTVAALSFCLMLSLPILSPNVPTLALSLLLLGAGNSLLDVSMNAQAVDIERRYQRTIMSSFHGLFSLGGLGGAALASQTMALGVSNRQHVVLTTILAVSVVTYIERVAEFPRLYS